MIKLKTITTMAFAAAVGTAAYGANPFSDVPRTHWAYESLQKAVDAGVLQGYDGKFHGERTVNRFQMAEVIKKLLDTIAARGGPAAAGLDAEGVKSLEQLTIEFADELAMLNTKVSTLEDGFAALRGEFDKLKAGSGVSGGGGLTSAFSGMVSVALLDTDDGLLGPGLSTPPPPFVGPPRTPYSLIAPDQTFFTIPQASMALDKEVGEGIGLHIQFDYGTNLIGPAGVLDGTNAGQPVGLNEAYLVVDEIFGNMGAKIGGFALPFQSWEINGPFRTCNYTITPSPINTAFEASRVVGFEISKMTNVDPSDVKVKVGFFSGSDAPLTSLFTSFGFMSDTAGMAGLSTSAAFDDTFGFYADLESGDEPGRNWGWRLGFFDMGGKNTIPILPTDPLPSDEVDGFNVGAWVKKHRLKVIAQYMSSDVDSGTLVGNAAIDSFFFLFNYEVNPRTNITLRWDDWKTKFTFPIAPPGAINGLEGDSYTFAINRKVSDVSMVQFEWIMPDELITNNLALPTGDAGDDQVQLRYKVWF